MPFSVAIKHTYTAENPTTKYTLADYDNIETNSDIASDGMYQHLLTNHRNVFDDTKEYNSLSDAIDHILVAMNIIADCGVRHLQNRATDKYTFVVVARISQSRPPVLASFSCTYNNKTTGFAGRGLDGRVVVHTLVKDALERHLRTINAAVRTPVPTITARARRSTRR